MLFANEYSDLNHLATKASITERLVMDKQSISNQEIEARLVFTEDHEEYG